MIDHPKSGADGRDSLLERASGIYDFDAALRGRAAPPLEAVSEQILPEYAPASGPFVAKGWQGPERPIDRIALAEAGYVLPDGPVTGIGEEFRIVKRQLLATAAANSETSQSATRVLICSALPGEGKTFCAVNLALSLAAEKDIEVLLVDADFANPSVLSSLGIEGGRGFMDALADPTIAIEDCVIRTDISALAVLPAGERTNNDTEYLASARMEQVLERLGAGRPNRIILFDSPPLLAASPASVLAAHVGLALLIVRADKTSESALRDAAGMLKAAPQVQLLLNGITFSASGRRFGEYYGYGDAQ
jgi:exopolysaccharide/PEP-CTERM locus tyrosine autokinase